MKKLTVLIGSILSTSVSGAAWSADAVMTPEPEPVEYVRICDMYGAGFFYIPGTDTCLSISGYAWYQVATSSVTDWWAKSTRVRLNFDARSETEWGTLRGYVRIESNWDSQNQVQPVSSVGGPGLPAAGTTIGSFNYGADGVARIDQAYITIGGLFMGYSESAWAAHVMDPGATNWGSHSWSGLSYGYQQRHRISYSFNANGFFGTLSVEDDGNANFMPDLVGKVGYSGGWGAVWARVAYDEDLAPASTAWLGARAAGLSGVDGWAASLAAQINMPNMPGSSFRIIGYYANNANAYSVGSRWSVLASYNHQFTSSFGASIGGQWFGDTNYGAPGNPTAWQVELSIVATPVTNLEVRAEINYFDPSGPGNNVTAGYLRLTRYF